MKKIVVILLLILPFVLIYSISFTGRILAEYTHVYVERLALLDEEENELPQGHVITLSKGEEYALQVKIFPELATNQAVAISNSDKSVCEIDEETKVVKALDYGVSDIVLTSKDRPITYSFRIRVFDADIQEIQVNKTELTLEEGQTETLHVDILPSTTLPENRNVIFETADASIAKVDANGKITALRAGETTVTVRSDYKADVFATVKVTVLAVETEPIVSFTTNTGGATHRISVATLNLKVLTVITVEGYTDLKYTVLNQTAALDESKLDDGVVTFLQDGVYTIEVSLVYQGKTEKATIRVLVQGL